MQGASTFPQQHMPRYSNPENASDHTTLDKNDKKSSNVEEKGTETKDGITDTGVKASIGDAL